MGLCGSESFNTTIIDWILLNSGTMKNIYDDSRCWSHVESKSWWWRLEYTSAFTVEALKILLTYISISLFSSILAHEATLVRNIKNQTIAFLTLKMKAPIIMANIKSKWFYWSKATSLELICETFVCKPWHFGPDPHFIFSDITR